MNKLKVNKDALFLMKEVLASDDAHECAENIREFCTYMKNYDGDDKEHIFKELRLSLDCHMVYDDDFDWKCYIGDPVFSIQNLLWYFLPAPGTVEEEIESLLNAADKFDELFGEKTDPVVEVEDLDEVLHFLEAEYSFFTKLYEADEFLLFLIPPNYGKKEAIISLRPEYSEELKTFVVTREKDDCWGPLYYKVVFFEYFANEMFSFLCDGKKELTEQIIKMGEESGLKKIMEESNFLYDGLVKNVTYGMLYKWIVWNGFENHFEELDYLESLLKFISSLFDLVEKKWFELFDGDMDEESDFLKDALK